MQRILKGSSSRQYTYNVMENIKDKRTMVHKTQHRKSKVYLKVMVCCRVLKAQNETLSVVGACVIRN